MNNAAANWWWRDDYQALKATFRVHFARFYADPNEPDAAREIDHRVDLWMQIFHYQEEWPAFLWELGRRTAEEMKDLPSWLELDGEKRSRIVSSPLFPANPDERFTPAFRMITGPESLRTELECMLWPRRQDPVTSESAFTRPMAFSVRLSDNDTAIVEGFKRCLGFLRSVYQVPNPKPNTGKRRRPFSWGYVEVFDSPIDPGDMKSQRIRSKASRLAAKYITPRVIGFLLSG